MVTTFPVVVLGGHAVAALERVLHALPESCHSAFVVACNGDLDVAGALRPVCAMPVVEVRGVVPLEAKTVYVAPPGHDILVRCGALVAEPADSPSAVLDRLLHSLANELGCDGVGVVLSGGGADGASGIKRLKEAGGITIAQRPGYGWLDEMPKAAIATGMIDHVLALDAIAEMIVGIGTWVDDPAATSTRMVSAGEATEAMLRDMESRLVRTWQQLRSRTQRCQIAVENLDSSHEELRAIIEQLRSTTADSHGVLRSAAMANHRFELGPGDPQTIIAIDAPLERALRLAPIIAFGFYGDGAITWGHVHGRRLDAEHAVALFAPGEADRLAEVARTVSSTRVGQRIELVLTTDEAACTYDLRVEPDGDTACACGFDITPSKQVEAALREADQHKDEFLATLSHELRNPLTPLRVALDVVRLADGDGARIDHSLAIMERQVDHLTHLVDELLDLSRIARGKIEIDHATIDPTSIVDAALDTARPLIDRRHHQLRVHLPEVACRVVGDFGRLTQALTNLLSNAAKYTPEGGHIDLDLVVDATRDLLFVRVRDDGVGIPPDMIEHIFDIFVQYRDTHGESHGGLGIGLNLVRRLVELHGGLVTATSAGAGLGSEFTIELPIAHTAAGKDVDADRVW